MIFQKHQHAGAGFSMIAEAGDELPLLEAGEIWAPRSWSIQWHTNPGWELFLQVKGSSLWKIGADEVEVPQNGAYLIRRDVRHRLLRLSADGSHFYYIVFPEREAGNEASSAACWQAEYSVFSSADILLPPLQGIIRELAIREAWQAQMCRGYLTALKAGVARLSERQPGARAFSRHPAAERALRLLHERMDHAWHLEELARLSGASVPHLIEIFQREYGQTPMRKLLQLRLHEAGKMLQRTDLPVTRIALDLGFASSQHFARAFKIQFGHTPSEARRNSTR